MIMLYPIDFGRRQTSGGNCLPTDSGEPGLKMAVLVVDPDNPYPGTTEYKDVDYYNCYYMHEYSV